MISVYQAERIILGTVKPFAMERCPLAQAQGRILREDIKSDRDQPPFVKVLMDGIAISWSAWQKGQKVFEIERMSAAGDPGIALKDKMKCIQVMTGAVLPKGCDCIIPIEQVHIKGQNAFLKEGLNIKPGQFIRAKGADAKKGDMLISKGVCLYPTHIGVAVSVGKTHVQVSLRPRVAIVATGDELVDIGKPILNHQIRMSNSYALRQLFLLSGLANADMLHLPDDKKILMSKMRPILKQYDIVVLSGGVSMGAFDYVPQVLMQLGVNCLFHKVAQKPGKPFWFGLTRTHKPVFALPGNPASTLVCAYRYIMPYLIKATGAEWVRTSITIKEVPEIKSPLVHFLPVKDQMIVPTGGSSDFAALVRADGFIEYDSAIRKHVRPYFSWRP